MKHNEFVYWLQGYFELSKDDLLTKDQINIIRAHIALSKEVTKKKSAFQNWLEGVFDSRGSEDQDSIRTLSRRSREGSHGSSSMTSIRLMAVINLN